MTALQPRRAAAGGLTATRPPTLLVVDDDDTLRMVLTRELRKRGFDVYSAGSGAEAVETYRRLAGKIDLALLDVNMPGMTGPDVLAALRAIDPFVRCCFMTADLRPDTRTLLLACGAAAVFGKPFANLSELCQFVRRLADMTAAGSDTTAGEETKWKS